MMLQHLNPREAYRDSFLRRALSLNQYYASTTCENGLWQPVRAILTMVRSPSPRSIAAGT